MRFLHSFCDGFPQVLNIFFGSLLEISLGIEYGRFYIPTGSLQKQAGRGWSLPGIHGFQKRTYVLQGATGVISRDRITEHAQRRGVHGKV